MTFDGCSGFTGPLTIPEEVTLIDQYAFNGCSGLTGSLIIPEKVTWIGHDAFRNCRGLTGSLIIPDQVTTILTYAFAGCSGFTGELKLPNRLTKIGIGTFDGCSGFTGSLTIPESVTSIGAAAFRNCSGFIGSLIIPDKVTSIGPSAFGGCNNLSGMLLLGTSLETLGMFSFEDCNFNKIISLNPTPPGGNDYYTFTDANKTALLYVPAGSEAAYTTSPVWSEFSSINTIVYATSITLNKTTLTLTNGATMQLSSSISPADATDKTVTWSSSDEAVATISASGLVTANSVGTATITASTVNGLKATCAITVVAATVDAAGLTLNLEEAEIIETNTLQLTATVTPADATEKTVTWSSSDEAVATISASGLVTANSVGTATITASTVNGLKATCAITVVAATVDAAGLTLNLEEAEIIENNTLQLTATITPENATDQAVTWSSSDEAVATVGADGLVTAKRVGTATITATTANNLTATCTITVVPATVDAAGLTLNLENAEIIETNTLQLTATVTPADATDKSVTWTSSDETVASVNATGLVTALKAGTATITASTANNLTATCIVTVVAKPSGIEGMDGDDAPAVRVEGGDIVVDGKAEVFSITGRRVAVSDGGRITGLPQGIYIVRSNGKSLKIKL
ncbi:MAG: Ig-like domain-containing protein [Paramuribaculum sp.]|nr:Ig-like domain-containing protein [Paramuribaculum sp.]